MSEKKLRKLFGTIWLPLYLLVGISWLLAPALAHEHYGTLRLISSEEASGLGASLWFRINDVLAALLLLFAVWNFNIGRHARWFGRTLVLVAVLAAIDGMFPDTCYIGHAVCGVQAESISAVHDVETIVLTALVGILSLADAVRHRRAASIGFIMLQLFGAAAFLTGLGSKQFIVLLQYAYETALILWLGWLIDRYNPHSPRFVHQDIARRVIGFWVAAGGVFAIVAALPRVHFIHAMSGTGKASLGLLLAQHGIVTGVLMLYLARHVLRGERPALWLASVLFYTQIIKYSVLTPQPVGLVVYAVLLALLVYARRGFDRNIQPPSWVSRLSDVGMVLGGLVLAVLIALSVVTVSGGQAGLTHDLRSAYAKPLHALDSGHHDLSERHEAELRTLVSTVGISVGVITLWSLFRPKAFRTVAANHYSREEFRHLLEQYSTSSEDFFKLWPTDKAYFYLPNVPGAVAYRVEGAIAFVLADPIAPTAPMRHQLLKAFAKFARIHGWVVCVLVIGSRSPKLYEGLGLQSLQIGSSAVIDIATFNTETSRSKWWRWQRNRAERNGWQYKRLGPPHDGLTLQALKSVSEAWLVEGDKTEQGFALGYFDEAYLQQCTIHTLLDTSGRIVAFANELPVFGSVKQASVDLIRYMPNTDGAMPVLLMHAIGSLAGSEYETFDLGFVPLAGLEGDLAKLLRRVGSNRFSAAGLEQFKNKFEPEWHADYLAYDGDLIDLAKIATTLERLLRVEQKLKKEVQ